jgi:hypothetical protein
MQYQKTFVMAGLVGASMLGGAVGGVLVGGTAVAQDARVVTATQVNLVDSSGQLRAVLSARDEQRMASISFYDVAGQVRGVMGIDENGTPAIRLMNAEGQRRLQAFLENEDVFVIAGDETGQSALFGTVGEAPMLNLSDGQRVRARLQLSPDGAAALGLFDPEGQRSVTMETDTLGSPFITLYEEGQSRTTMGVTQGAAVLNMSDGQRPRLVLGVAENGLASVSFLDENGDVEEVLPTEPQ